MNGSYYSKRQFDYRLSKVRRQGLAIHSKLKILAGILLSDNQEVDANCLIASRVNRLWQIRCAH